MANVTVRNLPDDVLDGLRRRASRAHRSLEEEMRQILGRAANADRDDFVRWIAENRLPNPDGMDVVENLRQDRRR